MPIERRVNGRDPRTWAIGVLSSLLLTVIGFHFVQTGALERRVAVLDERSTLRTAQVREQRRAQEAMLVELGGIREALHVIRYDLKGYAVTVQTVKESQIAIDQKIRDADILYLSAVATVRSNSEQIVKLFQLTGQN